MEAGRLTAYGPKGITARIAVRSRTATTTVGVSRRRIGGPRRSTRANGSSPDPDGVAGLIANRDDHCVRRVVPANACALCA